MDFQGSTTEVQQMDENHLLKKLGRPKSVLIVKKLAASAMNNIRKENQRNNQIVNSRKIIARIQEFINITEMDEDMDQDTIQNAKAMIEDKIIYLLERTEDKKITELFKSDGKYDLRAFLEAPEDIKDSKIKWLQSHLDDQLNTQLHR